MTNYIGQQHQAGQTQLAYMQTRQSIFAQKYLAKVCKIPLWIWEYPGCKAVRINKHFGMPLEEKEQGESRL